MNRSAPASPLRATVAVLRSSCHGAAQRPRVLRRIRPTDPELRLRRVQPQAQIYGSLRAGQLRVEEHRHPTVGATRQGGAGAAHTSD